MKDHQAAPAAQSHRVRRGIAGGLLILSLTAIWSASLISSVGMTGKAGKVSTRLSSDPDVSSITLSKGNSKIAGGYGVVMTGTVHLDAAAVGNTVVTLSSDGADAVVPADVTVLNGADTADFNITAPNLVAADETVPIHATLITTVDKDVIVSPLMTGMTLSGAGMIGGAGKFMTGTVACEDAPATNQTITLSDDSSKTTCDASVQVLAGNTTSETFTITGDTVVSTTELVTVTATAPDAAIVSGNFNMRPPYVLDCTLSASSGLGGTTVTGTVTMITAVVADTVIPLASSNTAAATVPASVTVLNGNNSATFTVTAQVFTGSSKTTTITADGRRGKRFTALAYNLTGLSWDMTTVANNGSATGTVTLSANAPTGGIDVTVTTSNALKVSISTGTVHVNAGSSTATFTATGHNVSIANKSATVKATLGSKSFKQVITVTP